MLNIINFNNSNNMEVKIKKLSEDAVIPSYAHDSDAGLDLTATSYKYDKEINCHIYGTGIAMEIPEGYVGLIYPRSSNRKTDVYMCNHVGVVDSGYRGEIMLSFKDRDSLDEDIFPDLVKPYNLGNRIGQIIIIPYPKIEFIEVDKLSSTDRGEQGHGSTGNDIIITFKEPYFKTMENINLNLYPEKGNDYDKDKENMDIIKEIKNTKQLRKDIDEVIQKVKTLESCRETSITITKLQEAVMWLGMNLKRLGTPNPYPESKNPENIEIEPTADGLKL